MISFKFFFNHGMNMTNSEIIPFRSVLESQRKSKITDSRRSEIEMPRKRSGKIVIFGQGKPGKVREIFSPFQVLRTMSGTGGTCGTRGTRFTDSTGSTGATEST